MNHLWLEECGLNSIRCEWLDMKPAPESTRHSLTVSQESDFSMQSERRFAQTLSVRISPASGGPRYGYDIEARISGKFRLPDPPVKVEENLRIIALNAAMILYGILRGHLITITACCAGQKLLLPTVDLSKILQLPEAKQESHKTRKEVVEKPVKKLTMPKPSRKTASRKKEKKRTS